MFGVGDSLQSLPLEGTLRVQHIYYPGEGSNRETNDNGKMLMTQTS